MTIHLTRVGAISEEQGKVTELARRLYRSLVFGDELDDSWAEAVREMAARRRVSEESLLLELVLEAETMLKAENGPPANPPRRAA